MLIILVERYLDSVGIESSTDLAEPVTTSRGVRNVKRVALYKKVYKIGRKKPQM